MGARSKSNDSRFDDDEEEDLGAANSGSPLSQERNRAVNFRQQPEPAPQS